MELVCPVCNGLAEYAVKCPDCSEMMEDQGPVVDYLDEYSPYLASDITQQVDGVSGDKCVHLYKCNQCNRDKRITINRVRI